MVTVIIPALNEEDTIGSVVDFALSQPNVSEVVVVDDKSCDNTVAIAREKGAKVITSTRLGKGASMHEGILYARNEVVAFLDGDIDPYPHFTIKLLTEPILQGEADFVKSAFNRNAGRVTELVAKPLLSIFFPDLMRYTQPLSGMIAGRKNMFQRVEFKDDYGVDVGILIDMYLMNAKMKEVEIGYLENKSKPLHELGKMSKEVAQTIITKASATGNNKLNIEELGMINEIRSQMDFSLHTHLKDFKKIVVFDMDNTLLMGRFIDTLAEKYGLTKALMDLRATERDPVILTKRIATLLKGLNYGELTTLIDTIPIVPGTKEVVAELKKRGYLTGIISDSYDFVVNHVKNKLGMDFAIGNEMEFSKGVCTGEVKIPSYLFNHPKSVNRLTICKTNALMRILEDFDIPMQNCIAIGDSSNDLWMIKEAGIGIAFCSDDNLVNHHADVVISECSFDKLLEIAQY